MAESPVERVVLVGFMGAGKSTVGRMLARRLGWRFHDLDERVEARAGRTVGELFAAEGEEAFRTLEGQVGAELLEEKGAVIATGGGWPVRDDRMGRLPDGTFSVWLQVSPEEAARRAAGKPGLRPLLDVPDPTETARRMLAERRPEYARADLHLRSDGASPDDVVRSIVNRLPERIGRQDDVPGEAPTLPRSLN